MGCAVNGPGEAKNADIGVVGGKENLIIYEQEKLLEKIKEKNSIKYIKKLIDKSVK